MQGFEGSELAALMVDHRVEVNSLDGGARVSVPLRLTRGREGFGPQLTLMYGGRNSPFGFGWSLGGVSSIGLDTRKGLPTYGSEQRFVLGGQPLVPTLEHADGEWKPRAEERDGWRIETFRARVERTYERIERWTRLGDGRVHWVVRGRDGTTSIYGRREDGSTRISDPDAPERTFRWLLESRVHPKGSAVLYEYKPEDLSGVDSPFEAHRVGREAAQRYLKRIRYGNTEPATTDSPRDSGAWRFEVVFDYGEHSDDPASSYAEERPWDTRIDPFSSYRAGFEVRTHRRCRRVLMFHRFAALGGSPCLVGATVLTHGDDPAGAMLTEVVHQGFRRLDDGTFDAAQTPPLLLNYSPESMQEAFEPAPADGSANVPAGIDGTTVRFFDLHGEGLPGLLMRREGAWYFKDNLGGGNFGPMRELSELPRALSAALELQDFDGDGNPDLVTFAGREAGRYTRERDGWQPYRPFASAVRADFANARPQWADLNGDGLPDLIVDRQDRFVWYRHEKTGSSIHLSRLRNRRGEMDPQRCAVMDDGSSSPICAATVCQTWWGSTTAAWSTGRTSGAVDSEPAS